MMMEAAGTMNQVVPVRRPTADEVAPDANPLSAEGQKVSQVEPAMNGGGDDAVWPRGPPVSRKDAFIRSLKVTGCLLVLALPPILLSTIMLAVQQSTDIGFFWEYRAFNRQQNAAIYLAANGSAVCDSCWFNKSQDDWLYDTSKSNKVLDDVWISIITATNNGPFFASVMVMVFGFQSVWRYAKKTLLAGYCIAVFSWWIFVLADLKHTFSLYGLLKLAWQGGSLVWPFVVGYYTALGVLRAQDAKDGKTPSSPENKDYKDVLKNQRSRALWTIFYVQAPTCVCAAGATMIFQKGILPAYVNKDTTDDTRTLIAIFGIPCVFYFLFLFGRYVGYQLRDAVPPGRTWILMFMVQGYTGWWGRALIAGVGTKKYEATTGTIAASRAAKNFATVDKLRLPLTSLAFSLLEYVQRITTQKRDGFHFVCCSTLCAPCRFRKKRSSKYQLIHADFKAERVQTFMTDFVINELIMEMFTLCMVCTYIYVVQVNAFGVPTSDAFVLTLEIFAPQFFFELLFNGACVYWKIRKGNRIWGRIQERWKEILKVYLILAWFPSFFVNKQLCALQYTNYYRTTPHPGPAGKPLG